MGRFRYDDNEEDEYDIDNNNSNNNDLGWEFVASNPGEEEALVPVENNREIFEDHFQHCQQHNDNDHDHDGSADPTTVSSSSSQQQQQQQYQQYQQQQQQQQQQQPTFYVVMQQDPMGIYNNNNHNEGGFYEYDERTTRRRQRYRSTYCCPTWLIMCLVAIISHIAWHAIHNGPPAPPPVTPLLQPLSFENDGASEEEHVSSTTGRTNSPMHSSASSHSSSSTWQAYLDNHCNMFLHSTRALFWETPKHVVIWWYRYMQDEVQQRWKDWNKVQVQYCSVSLSSSLNGHERIARFVTQIDSSPLDNDDDDDTASSSVLSSSSSSQQGLFFAKLQPLAIRAVADAMHTWRPKKTFTAMAASSSYPPLLLFASAMTPGLAMQDLGTTLSHVLIPTSDCENQLNVKQQRRRQIVLRPLLHLEASSDWDQDTLARHILDHVQEWSSASVASNHDDAGGGIVVLQHVHQLAPTVFAWLVRELSTPPTPHGSSSSSFSSSSLSSSSSQLYMHCQNVIFIFTSDTIGKSSIVRSIRQAATSSAQVAMANKPHLMPVNDDDTDQDDRNSNNNGRMGRLRRPVDLVQDISRPSLTLDIQHEMQVHVGGASASMRIAILPFLPYTQLDLAEIVTLGMEQYWQETCHQQQHQQRWSRLVTTRAAVQALVHERNVEYIVWKTVINIHHGSGGKSQNKGTKTTSTAGGGGGISSVVGPQPRQLPVVLLTFSSTGADPVQRYLLSIQVHLERCLQKVLLLNDKDDNNHNAQQEEPQSSFSFSKILVLDSSDDTGKRGILKECQQQQQHNDESACTEICSFPLV